ncbi:MAG: pyruvate, water dikinase [Deltaproteobacteria bacterium HGW-Deltaproteobacteria-8]|jgi:pyruvate,water dikinase|nr:MAG: pyruvate, water dikinase [Deltaproteobacteria bacterium HGW-Deltaproteobacteria-8]
MLSLSGIRDMFAFWRPKRPPVPFAVQFKKFEMILTRNNAILELMADMGDKLSGEYVFDGQYIVSACERLGDLVFKLISDLSVLTQRKNVDLFLAFESIQHQIEEELAGRHSFPNTSLTMPLEDLNRDVSEEAGNKLAHLGDVRNLLGLPTPDGFVITSKAFFDFMAHNDVTRRVEEGLARLDQGPLSGSEADEGALDALSLDIRTRILEGEVPRPVAQQIAAMLDVLAARHGGKATLFAVRSSAWGEDAEFSFAGQYESVLAVPADKVLSAYKRVLAGAYSPEVWRYRLHRNYKENETAMAVGCQAMVEAEVSGALYTYAPLAREEDAMVISATWGLGAPVVDGTAETDTYFIDRTPTHAVRSAEIAHKPLRLTALAGGGTGLADVEPALRDMPCLSPARIQRLAQTAMTIERFYKRPQDVEWSFDAQDVLYILQARPLNMQPRQALSCPDPSMSVVDATRNAEVIFSGKGTVVQHGVAVGKVFVARNDADLAHFPNGAILVTHHTSPRFSRVMRAAQGIITDVGSATGHMSALAREYRVPAVVNTGVATSLLKTGDEITLDTTRNAVFRGAVQELCRFELTSEESFEESAEYRLLRRLLKRIVPLNLVDPHSEQFKASACRTFHDITRWIHEKAVEELIEVSERHWHRSGATQRRLTSAQPLGLMVIDLDSGPVPSPEDRDVRQDELDSVPLGALLDGLTQSGMWSTEPMSVDLGSFMSSFTRTFSSASAAPGKIGRNLAVVSHEYMNLHLRLGYHFNIIDAYIGERVNDNYIYFRFLGGVTDFMRRSRRARCIALILERLDFRVEVHGDLVVGRIKKLPPDRMREKMLVLGGLIGYTRQLDVCLREDEDIGRHAEEFLKRITPLLEVRND